MKILEVVLLIVLKTKISMPIFFDVDVHTYIDYMYFVKKADSRKSGRLIIQFYALQSLILGAIAHNTVNNKLIASAATTDRAKIRTETVLTDLAGRDPIFRRSSPPYMAARRHIYKHSPNLCKSHRVCRDWRRNRRC